MVFLTSVLVCTVLLTVSVFISEVSVPGFTVSTFNVVSACFTVSVVEAESPFAESALFAALFPLHAITDNAMDSTIKGCLIAFVMVDVVNV